ncbi:hypothetical protein N9C10_03435 [Flavobacteriaceae bacterium]|nr:hypothetical protein [Flavobacteriaceae bacterium]
MSSAIVEQLTCPCNPGFIYRSKTTYSTHKKSKKHVAYDSKRKDEAITATRRDNEIDLLKNWVDSLTRENIKLKDENEILRKEKNNFITKLTNEFSNSS